ncbi:hypothetical protein V6N13_136441 [Hibiscus sabdariffa]
MLSVSVFLQHGILGARFLTDKVGDKVNKLQKTWKENPDSNGSEADHDIFATINREVPSGPDPLHNSCRSAK